MSSRIARGSVLTSLIALLLILPTSAAFAATVTPEDDPGQAGAAWLAGQYQDHPDSFGFGTGSLVDLIAALAGAGVGRDVGSSALAALEAAADDYIAGAFNEFGARGKVVLGVEVAGGDANDVDGRDVEQELRNSVAVAGAPAGLASDPFNLSLVILGLAATPDGVPSGPGDWLVAQQCGDGSFGFGAACPGDPDSTALAAQALLAAGQDAAADDAVAWLLGAQAGDGSFDNYGKNANSTGLAAQALRAGGETAAADAAAAWLLGLQFGSDADASMRGAIRFYEGQAASELQSIEGATLQAVLAFGAPRLDLLDLTQASAGVPTVVAQEQETPAPTETTAPSPAASETSPAPASTDTPLPAVSPTGTETEDELAETGVPAVGLVLLAMALVTGGTLGVRGRREHG